MGGRGASSGAGKYEKAVVYRATSQWKDEAIPDENGRYLDENGNRVSYKVTMSENPGFREIAKSPIGTRVTVHYPEWEFYVYGGKTTVVPAHEQYYEIMKSPSSRKYLMLEYTGNNLGRNMLIEGGRIRYSRGGGVRMDKIKDVREYLQMSDKVTIRRPKGVK